MQLESMLWLLPVAFMLHDFEEMIFLPAWLRKNRLRIEKLTPRSARAILKSLQELSQEAFSLAVAEEFLLLSLFTLLTVQFHWYAAWAGLALVFALHSVVHVLQGVLLRDYVPAILTGLAGLAFCLLAVVRLIQAGLISWQSAILNALLLIPVVVANLAAAHRLARWSDRRRSIG